MKPTEALKHLGTSPNYSRLADSDHQKTDRHLKVGETVLSPYGNMVVLFTGMGEPMTLVGNTTSTGLRFEPSYSPRL